MEYVLSGVNNVVNGRNLDSSNYGIGRDVDHLTVQQNQIASNFSLIVV